MAETMESAPQSTITHNAVIEFASRSRCTPRLSPRARRAHKKKACPAQKGGLKSAGPCQNHIPGATPRRAKTVDFGRYLRVPCATHKTFFIAQKGNGGPWSSGKSVLRDGRERPIELIVEANPHNIVSVTNRSRPVVAKAHGARCDSRNKRRPVGLCS